MRLGAYMNAKSHEYKIQPLQAPPPAQAALNPKQPLVLEDRQSRVQPR